MMHDAVSEFIGAMDAAGMPPAEPIAHLLGSGEIVRFQCGDDRKGRRNGWALLHLDGTPAGAFGSYKMGLRVTWRSDRLVALDPAERDAMVHKRRLDAERRARERDQQQREVADRCAGRWAAAGPPDPAHPYLVRKRVAGTGLRQDASTLLVPMLDTTGAIWNLQAIYPDGAKFFAKGGRQEGLRFVLGQPAQTLVVAEGFSTGATVHRATGLPVVVAFSSGNLRRVAVSMREQLPEAEIIIAADDDAHLLANPLIKKNLGVEAAKDAARAVGGRVALPPRGDTK